jgi:glycosyltransferase involved in cell wall biosynthesis
LLVSIIITNYNYGRFLTQAIDSALGQDYPDVEVIVVDDGSSDDSREVIARYGDRIIPILKTNSGQVSSSNVGYSHCRGDIVIFLDADDVLYADAVSKHARKLRDPAVVTSHGYLEVTNEDLEPTGRCVPFKLMPAGDYLKRFIHYGPMAYICAFTSGNAWSRRFLDRVMPMPEENRKIIGPDGYLSALAPLFGRIDTIEGALGQYRIHGSNRGPFGYRFDDDFLRARLEAYRARLEYAADWARKLGHRVDTERWLDRAGWKLLLSAQALHLLDETEPCVPAQRLVWAPLRARYSSLHKSLFYSSMLFFVKTSPRSMGLKTAKRMLDRTWGQTIQ